MSALELATQRTGALAPAPLHEPETLLARHGHLTGRALLEVALTEIWGGGRIALVSSFGTEAAVLLHMVSEIDRATPVVFLDTLRLFGETLRYRDALVARLGLTDVRTIKPEAALVQALDPKLGLWRDNADECCRIRKVEPLARALAPFEAWITGRKAYQLGMRSGLQPLEFVDGKFKVNPLTEHRRVDLEAYFERHDLPRHPLEADGFLSIGCLPCTDRVKPGEDPRAGRWRGQGKTECGIHLTTKDSGQGI